MYQFVRWPGYTKRAKDSIARNTTSNHALAGHQNHAEHEKPGARNCLRVWPGHEQILFGKGHSYQQNHR